MAQDNCLNGLPNGDPNFIVVVDNYHRASSERKVTWVYEAHVIFPGLGVVRTCIPFFSSCIERVNIVYDGY